MYDFSNRLSMEEINYTKEKINNMDNWEDMFRYIRKTNDDTQI